MDETMFYVQMTEAMAYVLMAFSKGPQSGAAAGETVTRLSGGRLRLGPATLYSILDQFRKEGYLEDGRTADGAPICRLTEAGREAYDQTLRRLRCCLADAEQTASEDTGA